MSSGGVVLFGGSGRLGRRLCALRPLWCAPPSGEVDISDATAVRDCLEQVRPDLVINSAAIVGLAEAERDRDLTYRVNALGAAHIARGCLAVGARLMYVSSAAVYGGDAGPHRESETPAPAYYYGWSKWLGEVASAVVEDHVIARTDFFDPERLKYRKVFTDHLSSRLPVELAARALCRVAESDIRGVLNVGAEPATLFELLRPWVADLEPIRIAESPMPTFPADLSLDTTRYRDRFGTPRS